MESKLDPAFTHEPGTVQAGRGAPCALCSKAGCEAGCPGLGTRSEDGAISSTLLAEWKGDQCTTVPEFVWAARALHLIDEVERLRQELRICREAAVRSGACSSPCSRP